MSTAGYVKLLLPPRQSRGNSHWGLGGTALIGTAAEFGELFVGDTEKWGKVVRAANTKAD